MTNRRALNHLADPSSSPLGLSPVSPICLKYQTLGHDVISDYSQMKEMLPVDALTFDQILGNLDALEKRLNSLAAIAR